MRVTKRQLKRIIREEKQRLLREQAPEQAAADTVVDGQGHHWPRVDWTNIEDLADKWTDQERKAFDKGDPSMMDMGETTSEAKAAWEDQVENAALDMESELTLRVRKVALQTMQEFTDRLINGDYA